MERSPICGEHLQYTLLKDNHLVFSHRVIIERSPICGRHLQLTL